jgi:hypothetical protein
MPASHCSLSKLNVRFSTLYTEIFGRESQLFSLATELLELRSKFDIIRKMKRQKRKKVEDRPVFDAIRKPTAPPTQKFGGDKPEEKVMPSGRKAKHKKEPDTDS